MAHYVVTMKGFDNGEVRYLSNTTGGWTTDIGRALWRDVEGAVGLMLTRSTNWSERGKRNAVVYQVDNDGPRPKLGRAVLQWSEVARWLRRYEPLTDDQRGRCLGCGAPMDSGAMLCGECGGHVHIGKEL
jgi:hypothetical protein